MKIEIRNLSAASRKRVTRQIHTQLRYLRSWHSAALCEANAAEYDGDLASAARWDAEASKLSAEFHQLEGTLS